MDEEIVGAPNIRDASLSSKATKERCMPINPEKKSKGASHATFDDNEDDDEGVITLSS